jgi:hypothetical protein
VYVGTDYGVFASEDSGINWAPAGTELGSTSDLSFMGTTLLAATFGRGIWQVEPKL